MNIELVKDAARKNKWYACDAGSIERQAYDELIADDKPVVPAKKTTPKKTTKKAKS